MSRIISCTRPRCAAYQVIRYVDGPKLMLTCTRRGVISLHELYVTQLRDGSWTEKSRKLSGEDAGQAIERAVNYGYNVVEISNRLRTEAAARR